MKYFAVYVRKSKEENWFCGDTVLETQKATLDLVVESYTNDGFEVRTELLEG